VTILATAAIQAMALTTVTTITIVNQGNNHLKVHPGVFSTLFFDGVTYPILQTYH
jgi:hypothetical protein